MNHFCVANIFDGWRPSPIDRPDGGHGRIAPPPGSVGALLINIHPFYPAKQMHSAVCAVVQCPSVRPSICLSNWCIVMKRLNLTYRETFFIAWWPHHSSFPTGDPTMKFRRDPQQGRQILIGALNRTAVTLRLALAQHAGSL